MTWWWQTKDWFQPKQRMISLGKTWPKFSKKKLVWKIQNFYNSFFWQVAKNYKKIIKKIHFHILSLNQTWLNPHVDNCQCVYVSVSLSLSNSMRGKENKFQARKRKEKNKIKGPFLFPPWTRSFPKKEKRDFCHIAATQNDGVALGEGALPNEATRMTTTFPTTTTTWESSSK